MRQWICTDLCAGESQLVAEWCAMAPGAPQKALSSWDPYYDRIVEAVKTTYPELSAESHDALLASIRSNFPETFVGDTKAVLGLVMRVATPLIANKRRQLWEANKASILPMIREAMPPATREFELYYTTTLLNQIFERYHPETWSTVDEIPEKLKGLVKEVVPTAVVQIMTGDGELRDEELVRLYKSGYEKCKTMLLERYATKLHDLAPRIIYAKNLCPSMEYPPQFAKDVAQEVSLKLLQKLGSYKFDSKFETWVGSIIENEAKTLGQGSSSAARRPGPGHTSRLKIWSGNSPTPLFPSLKCASTEKSCAKSCKSIEPEALRMRIVPMPSYLDMSRNWKLPRSRNG